MKKTCAILSLIVILVVLHPFRTKAQSPTTQQTSSAEDANKPSDTECPAQNRKALRAHLLALGTWAASTANYWLEGAKWEEDIDFRLTLSDQAKRLFSLDSYRFDSNRFTTNWQHALSGALYYNIYRCNDFSLFDSFTNSLYASLLWEYVSEYQEVISVNDMIYNSLGALTIGENLFQMGAYLQGQRNGFRKSLGFLINPVMTLNSLLGGSRRAAGVPTPHFAHDASLRLSLGQGDLIPLQGNQQILSTKVSIDILPKPSGDSPSPPRLHWQNRYLAGHFSLSLTGNRDGIKEFHLKTRNLLLGWQMDISQSARHRNLLLLGLCNGLSLYRKKAVYPFDTNAAQLSWDPERVIDEAVAYTDKMSTLGIVGSTLIWIHKNGPLQVNLETGLNLNFAMINSLPLNRLSENRIISDTKATLLYYGYYYALGYCLSMRGKLDYHIFSLLFDLEHHGYSSIDGLDRFQKKLLWDPDLSDKRTFLDLGLFLRIGQICSLGCVYETIQRQGKIADFFTSDQEHRFSLILDFPF